MKYFIFILLAYFSLSAHPIVIVVTNARSVSTALECSFRQRGDFFVFHEPFLRAFSYRKFGKAFAEKLGMYFQTGDDDEVAQMIKNKATEQPVFVKDLATAICPYIEDNPEWLHDPDVSLVFLIRNPAQTLESNYLKTMKLFPEHLNDIPTFQRFDLQYQLMIKLQKLKKRPIVIDAEDLLKNPFRMMQKLCKTLSLPFDKRALSWKKGMREEWKPFAVFHEETANSEGFLPFEAPSEPFKNVQPQHLEMVKKWYARSRPYYDEMHKKRLKLSY